MGKKYNVEDYKVVELKEEKNDNRKYICKLNKENELQEFLTQTIIPREEIFNITNYKDYFHEFDYDFNHNITLELSLFQMLEKLSEINNANVKSNTQRMR